MELLKADKFVADPKKCKFFVKEVEFCGHVLGNGTRRPAPGKLMAIERWQLPRTISELRAFLGSQMIIAFTYICSVILLPLSKKC
jgi:hypothetical protein